MEKRASTKRGKKPKRLSLSVHVSYLLYFFRLRLFIGMVGKACLSCLQPGTLHLVSFQLAEQEAKAGCEVSY